MRQLETIGAKVASTPSICTGARITFERQKVCQRKSRARLQDARARESLLKGRSIWRRSRERDLYKRERESRVPGDVIAAFS
ncbi:hypothetical protein JCGZ_18851 [Jatropha curcas]|uniref:Uncharacterized protein n=1 Tax=Jatropha curcas TaxID=180498 RepID=A0A067KCZ2_JATCU|nr:hypothetical protein JCGZ_18851 [Jatropha curcas]